MKSLYDSIPNFRDIGGYLGNLGKIKTGVIFRSGNLSKISMNDLISLQNQGIKTVIDLRSENAKARDIDPTANHHHFIYRSFFIKAGERLPLSEKDNFSIYQEMFSSKEELLPILKQIIVGEKGILIHCSAGKDRTGVVVSLLLSIAMVSIRDINQEYLLSFDDLADHLSNLKHRNIHVSSAYYTKDEAFLPAIFDWIENRYGSIENYYQYLGLTSSEIQTIQKILIE